MELRQLRYFVQIAEARSFGRAALALRIAQPALSLQVRKLEDELQVQLLTRHAGGVMPTEAGQVFLDHARGILRQIEQARRETTERAKILSGKVAVGVAGPICMAFGAKIARDLMAMFPSVDLNIVEGRSVQIEEWLLNGNLDLAVLYEASDTPKILRELLFEEELVLYSPGDDPLLPSRSSGIELLASLPIIAPSRPNTIRHQLDRVFHDAGLSFSPAMELNSYAIGMRLVSEGAGYGLLPEICVASEARQGTFRICRLPQPLMQHRLFLSSSTERPLTKAARRVAGALPPLIAGCYELAGLSPVASV